MTGRAKDARSTQGGSRSGGRQGTAALLELSVSCTAGALSAGDFRRGVALGRAEPPDGNAALDRCNPGTRRVLGQPDRADRHPALDPRPPAVSVLALDASGVLFSAERLLAQRVPV